MGCSVFLQSNFAQPKTMHDAMKIVARRNTEFGLTAYAKMGRKEGNVFFSPFSLSVALTMAYGGAKGETAAQIANVLSFPADQQNIHSEMGLLLKQLTVKEEYLQLFLANALWGQRDLTVIETYQNLLRTNYNSAVKAADFVGNPREAANAINAWAAQSTNGRITDLVSPDAFQQNTLLLLANAVYFKARWENEFRKSRTIAADFWISSNTKTTVQMMQQQGYLPYFDDEAFQVLELPYVGQVSMLVVLPKARRGLADIEKQLSAVALEEWFTARQRKEVEVYFPQFEMEADLSLKNFLANLGMPLAFQDKADFSGIAKHDRGIKLDDALQKTFIKVDEEGTEAAAVTALGAAASSAAMPPKEPPPVFRADHPFLFFIKENSTNSILFMGRVANPNQKRIKFEEQKSVNTNSTPKPEWQPTPSAVSPTTKNQLRLFLLG